MKELREKALKKIPRTRGDYVLNTLERVKIADELITLIRTATLDEVTEALGKLFQSPRVSYSDVIETVENLRGK